jgi:Amt family ammonium transporter
MDSGDTAWILTSTALVTLMTFGLAIFYGSLVGEKHLEEILTRVLVCIGIVTIQWVLFGYSFAFGINQGSFWGNFMWGGLVDLGDYWIAPPASTNRIFYAPTIPSLAFCVFQMTFAFITSSLITGALVGRMSFLSWVAFTFLWTTLVYDPIAHWVWSDEGWLRHLGSLDFAGGSVVHISSGVSALSAAIVMGKRHADENEGEKDPKVDVHFNLLGGALLWVGWFGFNGGSALTSGQIASLALINSHICAASAMFFWMIIEALINGSCTVEGAIYGAICGLVVITPAAGYVLPGYCIIIGLYTAILCYGFLVFWRKYATAIVDDSLYVFCSHGVGGIIGSFTTGLFATLKANPGGANGAFYGRPIQLGYQMADICATASWSFVVTAIITIIVRFISERVFGSMDTIVTDVPKNRKETNFLVGGHSLATLQAPNISQIGDRTFDHFMAHQ